MAIFTFNDNPDPDNPYNYSEEELSLNKMIEDIISNADTVNGDTFDGNKKLLAFLPKVDFFIKKININKDVHKNRNKKQTFMAPESYSQMQMLIELKLFKLYGPTGHTGTHNLYKHETTPDDRWNAFLGGERGINVDCRGIKDTIFEGIQLVYNEATKVLILGNLNKGTFDFSSPDRNKVEHFEKDIKPWLAWGNMGNDRHADIVIKPETWKRIEKSYNDLQKAKTSFKEFLEDLEKVLKPKKK